MILGGHMTWYEFKRILEHEGVTDDMRIDYIDMGYVYDDEEPITVNIDAKSNMFSVY